jgi:hypothetical protein
MSSHARRGKRKEKAKLAERRRIPHVLLGGENVDCLSFISPQSRRLLQLGRHPLSPERSVRQKTLDVADGWLGCVQRRRAAQRTLCGLQSSIFTTCA